MSANLQFGRMLGSGTKDQVGGLLAWLDISAACPAGGGRPVSSVALEARPLEAS